MRREDGMKILIKNGRVISPASNLDALAEIVASSRPVTPAVALAPSARATGFVPNRVIDARGCVVLPGLVDLAARLREPGHEHEGMLESEMAAAVAGGVTSLVCPPDTDPVLDEPGLVEMLKFRAEKLHQARVFPLGALTRGLRGEVLTEMVQLTEAGCVGFGQADVPLANTQVLQRALQYAATFGYTVWLRPQDAHLGRGVAASGALATRMGLSGVPVAPKPLRCTPFSSCCKPPAHACTCAASAAPPAWPWCARPRPTACGSRRCQHQLAAPDRHDIGYFDSRARLSRRCASSATAMRCAPRWPTAPSTRWCPTTRRSTKTPRPCPLPKPSPAPPGWSCCCLALKWGQESGVGLTRALAVLTSEPARVLGSALGTLQASVGQLVEGGVADLCVFDPQAAGRWNRVALRSQGKHTPFAGHELPGACAARWWAGRVAFERDMAPTLALRCERPPASALCGPAAADMRVCAAGALACWRMLASGWWTIRTFPALAQAERDIRACRSGRALARICWHRAGRASWAQPPCRGRCCWWPTTFPGSTSWCCTRRGIAALSPRRTCKRWPLMARWPPAPARCTSNATRAATRCAWCTACARRCARRGAGGVSRGHHQRRHRLLPFHANLLQAAISAQAPVQPVGLHFVPTAATGALSFAPIYIGDDSLVGSVWRTLTARPRSEAVVRYGAPEPARARAPRLGGRAARAPWLLAGQDGTARGC
jgi:dihydroorotase